MGGGILDGPPSSLIGRLHFDLRLLPDPGDYLADPLGIRSLVPDFPAELQLKGLRIKDPPGSLLDRRFQKDSLEPRQ